MVIKKKLKESLANVTITTGGRKSTYFFLNGKTGAL